MELEEAVDLTLRRVRALAAAEADGELVTERPAGQQQGPVGLAAGERRGGL